MTTEKSKINIICQHRYENRKKNSFIHKEIFFYQGNDIMILIPTVRYIDPNILLKQLSFKYNIKKIDQEV